MARLRVRLTFPAELVQRPILYHLVKDFEGSEERLAQGVAWLERQGVAVDPIERDVVLP